LTKLAVIRPGSGASVEGYEIRDGRVLMLKSSAVPHWRATHTTLYSVRDFLSMEYPNKSKWIGGKPIAVRYGFAVAAVAAATGLAQLFLYFHLALVFNAFALSAIAITFWYGGTKPGILAAVLSALVRSYVFDPDISRMSRVLYDLVFLVFALLMSGVTRARDELEVRVAERTAELTQANEKLSREIGERKRAEEQLRQSEAYLAEAQRLTHTGSWVWQVDGRDAMHLSEEWYRIYGHEPAQGTPAWEQRLQRVHPEDRTKWQGAIERAIAGESDYEVEFRILLPSGAVKHIHTVGHPVLNASGELVQFVGSSTDITERKRAEEALRQAQAELARVSRVTTMGELTASLAHEVNQPITAAVTDANTCLRWLTRDHPDLEEAREAASRIVKDAVRASDIINRMRSLFKKESLQRGLVDVNEVIREMTVLLRSEATRYSISMRTELSEGLPNIMGDHVQLQQVLMNLMINGIEAMKDVAGPRELAVKSQRAEDEQLMVSVSDTGVGLPPQQAHQIFDSFFTTKRDGTGMGLRISRSIVESHGGRLWAADNSPRGASFHLTLPSQTDANE
jgi:PAS domain S-box-containing protein